MHILPYDDIPRKEQLVPVLHHAFQSLFDPWAFEEHRREDFRLRGGPIAFCAVEEDTVAGIVGVMNIPTRTLDGEETVGAIWTVATHPAFARRGISTALMERAHAYFRERGFRLSFLTTARSLVAYRFYRKLGYQEVRWTTTRPMAYRVVPPEMRGKSLELPAATEEGVAPLFQRFTAKRTGFVLWPPDFLGLKIRHGPLEPDLCLQTEGGYVLASRRERGADVRQLVALNLEAQHALLEALEGRASVVVNRLVAGDSLLRGYEARGYLFAHGTYGLLLAKALEPEVSVDRLYGDAFYISRLEWF